MIDFFESARSSGDTMWHEDPKYLRERLDRIVCRMHDETDSFVKSIIVPTDMYPLNCKNYRVFTYNNTSQIKDEKILAIIDEIPYHIGCCYQNTEAIVKRLTEAGYNVRPYCGWLFLGADQYPIHHCWAVLNGESVIDLCDDMTMLHLAGGENLSNKTIEECRDVLADFAEATKDMKNSLRCLPVGQPTPYLYYVGCECDTNEGRRIYQALMKRYPRHECQRNCDSQGFNSMQRILYERGLMK